MLILMLKVHNVCPKVTFPHWLHPLEIIMVSNSERIMEKSRNSQIVYVGHTNLCKHCITDHARGTWDFLTWDFLTWDFLVLEIS